MVSKNETTAKTLDISSISGMPIHYLFAAGLLACLVIWAIFAPFQIILGLVCAVIAVAGLILTVTNIGPYEGDLSNLIIFLTAILAAIAVFTGANPLLILLFAVYTLLALLLVSKKLGLQMTIIIFLVATAVCFRAYPAMEGTMAGNPISMDDPYYHYKFTHDLYQNGEILATDYRVNPPYGLVGSQLLPYYYNAFLAFTSGIGIEQAIILYPLLISAFAAIMIYFFMKELSGDWKTGVIAGFLFATMPMILTKSTAGAIEEDIMGMAIAVFAFYLLTKSFKVERTRDSVIFAALSGITLMMLAITWSGGAQFLYAVPFVALGIFAVFTIIGRYDMWKITRAGLIAGIVSLCGITAIGGGLPSIFYIGSFGFFALFAVLSEVSRVYFFKEKEDSKKPIEKKFLLPLFVVILVVAIGALVYYGPSNIVNSVSSLYSNIAGEGTRNFLVEKTISEQGALASGSIAQKLNVGLDYYGIAEGLSLFMLILLPVTLIYWFLKQEKEKFYNYLLAYCITLMFFIVAMVFVWGEARLGFSQSLGFLLLGSLVGIFFPKDRTEFSKINVILPIVIIPLIAIFVFAPMSPAYSWGYAARTPSIDPAWVTGIEWLSNNVENGQFIDGTYVPGDYVFTWWDYGHIITALSDTTVITEPTQANEEYIMRTARFFYNESGEDAATKWLMEQPWNKDLKTKYIILDYSLVGKAGALTFLGTNFYEYQNGFMTNSNGTCDQGFVCQNIETGERAKKSEDGTYSCDSGIVCLRDALTKVVDKKCCQEQPTECCDMTLDWHVAREENGTGHVTRSAGYPVFNQYSLAKEGQYICRPEYTTSSKTTFLVENGERKTITQSQLYAINWGGLPFADGNAYGGILLFEYADGSTGEFLISENCERVPLNDVLSLGKDELARLDSQLLIHAPERWSDSMFFELYVKDARDLEYYELVTDADAVNGAYPNVKIFRINYPDKVPVPGSEDISEPLVSEEGLFSVDPNLAREGSLVKVHYTGTLDDGTVFESSIGGSPLEFTIGAGQMIAGFDAGVNDMKLGETKNLTLPPEEAYGASEGHPLQNETLHFEVTLVSIGDKVADAYKEELEMKFDANGNAKAKEYNLSTFPAVVWDCRFAKEGIVGPEGGVLAAFTCIATNGEPKELCSTIGVAHDNKTEKLTLNKELEEYVAALKMLDSESCLSDGKTVIEAFYTEECDASCEIQREIVEQLKSDLAGLVDVTFYCVGTDEFCKSRIQ